MKEVYIGYLEIEELWGLGIVGAGGSRFKMNTKNRIIVDWFTYCISKNMPDLGISWFERSLVAHAIMLKGKSEAVMAVASPEEIDWQDEFCFLKWDHTQKINSCYVWKKMWPERWKMLERQRHISGQEKDKLD